MPKLIYPAVGLVHGPDHLFSTSSVSMSLTRSM